MRKFRTTYRDISNGSWSGKWAAYQLATLPPHRIDHVANDLRCTCGAGPFAAMIEWSEHAVTEHA